MATSCPPQVAPNHAAPTTEHLAAQKLTVDGTVALVFSWIGRVLCGLQGHEHLLQFDRERLYLKCTSCGHESPGWSLSAKRPVPLPAPVRQPRVVTRPVTYEKRVA